MNEQTCGALGGEKFVGTGGAATSSLAAASGAVPAASLTQPHSPDPFLLRLPASRYGTHADTCPGTTCSTKGCGAHVCDEDGGYCEDCTAERKAVQRDTNEGGYDERNDR